MTAYYPALLLFCSITLMLQDVVLAEPHSKPYIPYRTDPREHPFVKHTINWEDDRSFRGRSNVKVYDAAAAENTKKQCPLQFTLGVSRRAHNKAQKSEAFSIVKPPVIHPIFPARGPGRQLVHTTLYEHLDLLSPELARSGGGSSSGGGGAGSSPSVIKEGLIQHQEFPLLFESSSFAYSVPIIHDVNGDGIPDAILADYDGGIYIVGLHQGKEGKRWFHKAQVPRIFVRRTWVEARVNETYKALHSEEAQAEVAAPEGEEGKTRNEDIGRDPYHSYFEYSSSSYGQKDVLRGVTANVLGQKPDVVDALKDRRNKKRGPVGGGSVSESADEPPSRPEEEATQRRRLLEVSEDEYQYQKASFPRRRLLEVESEEEDEELESTFPRRRLQEGDQQQEQTDEERRRRQEDEERRRREEEEERHRREEQERQERERAERERKEQEERERQERERREKEERERQEREERERQEQRERQQQEEQERQRRQEEEEKRRQEEEAKRTEERKRLEEEARLAEERKRQEEMNQQQQQPQQDVQNQQQGEQEQKKDPEVQQGDQEQKTAHEGQQEQKKDPEAQDGQEADRSAKGVWTGSESESDSYSRSGRGDRDEIGDDEFPSGPSGPTGDDIYPDRPLSSGDDMYGGGGGYDDYYGRYRSYRDDYYDEKHYVRINPHILATPALAEVPKLYGNDDEVEDLLIVPVSYYLDEDEYEGHLSYRRFENTDTGDETEVQRGQYVASAIMLFHLGGDPRWGRQEHLDLSTDHSAPQNVTLLGKIPVSTDNTKMGAFALSKPAVADIDGDGKLEILIGTSMGIVYAFDATHMTMKDNWPIQMQYAVESPILVEDVAANTKLEVFVADIGGNIAQFDEGGNKAWHRDLWAALSEGTSTVRATSPMTLGDVDGDGVLDIVVALQIFSEETHKEATYVFAINAGNGRDLDNFPISFETPASQRSKAGEYWVHQQLAGLLLVDLHADQSHIRDYIRRNATKWEPRKRESLTHLGGGNAPGLHIVMPLGEMLYVIEAGSGCTQNFGVGEEMVSMVQVDDVHGTNSLDLVVSTTAGNIITMESNSQNYHPLNVWNNGESRGRLNNYAHGFSASQGIFVHSVSRQYRDIFGVFVPVTFEIFDNRANIAFEADRKIYKVEIRDGTSTKRAMWRNTYNSTGVYTERLYIPHGPGYYSLTVQLRASNGLVYEDIFHVGYNVNYMDGFGLIIWLPLLLAAITIFLGSSRNIRWDDDDYESRDRNGAGLGILG